CVFNPTIPNYQCRRVTPLADPSTLLGTPKVKDSKKLPSVLGDPGCELLYLGEDIPLAAAAATADVKETRIQTTMPANSTIPRYLSIQLASSGASTSTTGALRILLWDSN
ncbi:hypothetical protein M8C21_017159, partial [Ambrosia artemisiifolia]